MPDPEIDRRCTDCGASVRPHALFCPQCGQPIVPQSGAPDPEPTNVVQAAETATDPSETQPLVALPDLSKTQPLTTRVSEHVSPPKDAQSKKSISRITEGNVMGRVEKLRKVSSVVIDEAAYDPSIRFILVTAVLFILFLVLLILSKVLS